MGSRNSNVKKSLVEQAEIIEETIYSFGEEIANSITHGIGALLSIAALTMLVILAVTQDDPVRIVSAVVYGSSLILLFLFSTIYHSLPGSRIKKIFQLLDHCAIYLLIAGTYTPVLLISLKGAWGYSLMVAIWSLALFGIFFKVFFGEERFPKLSLFTYISMGWLIIIASTEMISAIPPGGLILLAAGGVVYTAGVAIYVRDDLPYNHAVWHLFVLGGSACHFFAVYKYVLPPVQV
ncbi:MAG TPA: hemolysin D [Chromatiales bacterium]|nr:hemolysin D [Thiotrichales bacterium]HIP67054.1 hemolysin D [Chromatiales bacterium]